MTPKNHVHFEAKKLFGDVGKIIDAYCLKGKKMDIRYRKIEQEPIDVRVNDKAVYRY